MRPWAECGDLGRGCRAALVMTAPPAIFALALAFALWASGKL